MAKIKAPLRGAVVGCRMGAHHAQVLASLPAYELEAVCDLNLETAQEVAASTGAARVYASYSAMLAEVRPEVVAIATPTSLHAAQTLQAAQAGVRGICCEKPLAVNLADGRRMVAACHEAGVALIVNHQRRLDADLVEARRLIAAGALGGLIVLRGSCAGDEVGSNLFLQDAEGGWVTGREGWVRKPVPAKGGERGTWRPVELPQARVADAMAAAYTLFAATLAEGAPHPMGGEYALRDLEVLMAVYESARLHRRLSLPLAQERHPLELMIEAGEV